MFDWTCPVCGAVIRNLELHQQFHDGLRDVARRIYAPEMSAEEYDAAIRAEWERQQADGDASH